MHRLRKCRVNSFGLLGAALLLALCCSQGSVWAGQPSVQRHAAPEGLPNVAPGATPLTLQAAAKAASESVEADVSMRNVAITSSFTGTEIVVFGSVENSRQPSPESGLYDVVVVVEGSPTPVLVRKKGNVAGMWVNTKSVRFVPMPSYYAIISTRPIEDIAEADLLAKSGIGFEHVAVLPARGFVPGLSDDDMKGYQKAVIRLKQKDGLYVRQDYGVGFIGRSLFRCAVELPANVPVGPLKARVYLFRDGGLLGIYTARVKIERAGIELLLHDFSKKMPLLYGLFAVAIAVGAGLLASVVFRRSGSH